MAIVATSTSSTPGVRTFAQLKAEVLSLVRAPDSPAANTLAGQGINRGILELNMQTWQWALSSTDLTMVASTATYTLPDDWKAPRALVRLDSNSKPRGLLNWDDPKTFDTKFPWRYQDSTPQSYTAFRRSQVTLELNRPPNAGFVSTYPTLTHRYYSRVQKLVNDGDSLTNVPSEVEVYIVSYGEYYMARRFDPSRVRDSQIEIGRLWTKLRRDDRKSETTDWNVYNDRGVLG